MKVKDLIKQLERLPQDANICINWDDFHIWAKYYQYDEDLKQECWCQENDLDWILKNRDKLPEKIRWRFIVEDDLYRSN